MADQSARTISSISQVGDTSHDHAAEWARGGWSRIDLAEEIDVNTINYVDVVESCKVWEYLKMPILCVLCKDPKTDPVIPERVHWLYQACTTCTG